jgi:hypothetical protein
MLSIVCFLVTSKDNDWNLYACEKLVENGCSRVLFLVPFPPEPNAARLTA